MNIIRSISLRPVKEILRAPEALWSGMHLCQPLSSTSNTYQQQQTDTQLVKQALTSQDEVIEQSNFTSVYSNKKYAWSRELNLSLQHPDYFSVVDMFTVEDLFKARLHLGHREGTLNPFMVPYVLGSRLSHLIIDLDQTVSHLHKALNFLAHMAFRDGIVLFVCRQQQHQYMVEEIASSCGEFAHTRWWAGGVLTNSTRQFDCTVRLPDVIILLSTHNHILDNHIALNDAAKMLIPTVGVIDTNCDPRLVTYPVPASDDSQQSIEFLAKLFARAIMRGKQRRKELMGEQEPRGVNI